MMLIGILCLSSALTCSFAESRIHFSELSTRNATVKQIIVDIHNELRRSVTPPARNMLKMEWNEEAAIMASCSAKSCVLSYSNPFQRFIQNSYCGELKFMSTTTLSWKTVIQSFYKQSEHFDYQTGKKDTGPYIYYTQVVRYNSHQLGCAIAECNRSIPYFLYVCYYCPSFSIHKERPYEAGPPCSACPGSCDDGLCTNACKYEDVRPNCDILKVHCNCGDVLIRKECGATCYCNNNEIK